MAKEHRPIREANGVWHYPATADVLEEVGLQTMDEYIFQQRNTIAEWIMTRRLFLECWKGRQQ